MECIKRDSPFEGCITENFQVEYWAGKFGVRPAFLREIMKSTGNELAAVRKYFNQ
jgi:hypothetical protein